MSRPKRSDTLTGDLFFQIPRPAPAVAGGMDFRTAVSVILGDMLTRAKAADPEMDRAMIAAKVSRLTGKDVTKAMFDGYTAESRDAFNTPLYLVPAIETVCVSTALTDWLAGVRGGRLMLGPEAIDAEIGRIQTDLESSRERLRELRDLRRRVR